MKYKLHLLRLGCQIGG